MSGSSETRWWEGYLVRYLMPSIASAGIILWLADASPEAASILLIPTNAESLRLSSLILLLLYANLFCYVSSLPILAFHASRSVDFSQRSWLIRKVIDPYILSTATMVLALVTVYGAGSYWACGLSYLVASAFSAVQIGRLIASSRDDSNYGFIKKLGQARAGVPFMGEETCTNKEKTTYGNKQWWEEVTDSYRHMREHGNSGFIFLLQLATAAFVYAVIAIPDQSARVELTRVAILFGIWAAPAAFVHLLGQTVERHFAEENARHDS